MHSVQGHENVRTRNQVIYQLITEGRPRDPALPSCGKKKNPPKEYGEKAEVFISQERKQKRRDKIRAPQLSPPPQRAVIDGTRVASTPRMCVRGIVRMQGFRFCLKL